FVFGELMEKEPIAPDVVGARRVMSKHELMAAKPSSRDAPTMRTGDLHVIKRRTEANLAGVTVPHCMFTGRDSQAGIRIRSFQIAQYLRFDGRTHLLSEWRNDDGRHGDRYDARRASAASTTSARRAAR